MTRSFKLKLALLSIPAMVWILLLLMYLISILLLSFLKTQPVDTTRQILQNSTENKTQQPPKKIVKVKTITPVYTTAAPNFEKGKFSIAFDIDDLTLNQLRSLYKLGWMVVIKTPLESFSVDPLTGKRKNIESTLGVPLSGTQVFEYFKKLYPSLEEVYVVPPNELLSEIKRRAQIILSGTDAKSILRIVVGFNSKSEILEIYVKKIVYKTNSGEVKTWMRNY